MTNDAWITVAILLATLGLLLFTRLATDLVMAGALTVLVTLRVLEPNESVALEFTVPKGSRGTHWYHPHAHGMVARQLFSGMAGAIVVEGEHGSKRKNDGQTRDDRDHCGRVETAAHGMKA